MKIFKDRQAAGKLLAKYLKKYTGKDVIVLGIPRGGVVVAIEVAKKLKLPLDILVVRKIGAPFQKELALGAIDPDGEVILDDVLPAEVGQQIKEEWQEVKRRENEYRAGKLPLKLRGKKVILVDDGIATGSTTLAAINYLKRHEVKKIILAVPVASKEAIERMIKEIGDIGEIRVLETPDYFEAVGQFYAEFLPVSDEEVVKLLNG